MNGNSLATNNASKWNPFNVVYLEKLEAFAFLCVTEDDTECILSI